MATQRPLGITTRTLRGHFDEKVAAAASAGFDRMEVWADELTAYPGGPVAAKAVMDAHGIDFAALQLLRDIECQPPERARAALDEAERLMQLMNAVGAELLLVCATFAPDSYDDPAQAARDLHALGELAHRYRVRIGFEALSFSRWIPDVAANWRIVAAAAHPSVGIVLDSAHFFLTRSSYASIDAIPGDRIAFVQIADLPTAEGDRITLNRHRRLFPGEGIFPIDRFLAHVLATGASCCVSLEIFNDEYAQSDPIAVAQSGIRALRKTLAAAKDQRGDPP